MSAKTSAMPIRNAPATSTGRFSTPSHAVRATAVSTPARVQLAMTMIRRRSYRSASAPACSVSSSHGSAAAALTSEISSGERVRVTAMSATPTIATPSPTLDRPEAVHNQRNDRPIAMPPVSCKGKYANIPLQRYGCTR